MTSFPQHAIDAAPDGARPILEAANKALGFVPNLYATMADAPALLQGYTSLSDIFDTSSLSATERQIVLLAASFENGCDYCMAAHTTIGGMQKVPADIIEALRAGTPIADVKLEALRTFTRSLVRERGRVSASAVQALLDAGYPRSVILEVVLGVGLKTMSNYLNHLADTPLDAAFQSARWERSANEAA